MVFFWALGLLGLISCGREATPEGSVTVRLNEIMASNGSTIADADGDYEDWIELYNYGEQSIDLRGFYLSDDFEEPKMWELPRLRLGPGEYRLIWASGKDRAQDELHTNFSIARSGEEVLLVSPDGEIIDQLSARKIPTDISVGRYGEGKGDWYYYDQPSPGRANGSSFYQGIMAPPEFSVSSGFYDTEFELSLTAKDSDAVLLFTLDGSIPDINNLEGSVYQYKTKYPRFSDDDFGELIEREYRTYQYTPSNPIKVSDRLLAQRPFQHEINTTWNNSNVLPDTQPFRGVAIRASAHKVGYLPSETVAHSYFLPPEGCNRYSVPVFSLITSEKNLFDYHKGIYVPGVQFDQWRKANPKDEADGNSAANYTMRGRAWEREAHVELLDGCEGSVLNQRAGVRIHGGWTRSYFKKSLRFYARNQYGDRWFDYPLFGGMGDEKFRRFILRQSGNDMGQTLFRDALMHRLVENLDLETQHYNPAVLFINGEYWGVHNLRERIDRHYLSRRRGVDPDNLDLLSIDGGVDEGSDEHYRDKMIFVDQTDLSSPRAYQHLKTLMDIDNYVDYHTSQVYFTNRDWPGNNIAYWRVRTDEYKPHAESGHDGRWRWILYDTDHAFFDPKVNMFEHTAFFDEDNPDPWWTRLFRNILDNKEFRQKYINRLSDHLNTIFRPEVVIAQIDELEQGLAPLMDEHISLWRNQEVLNWGNRPIRSKRNWRQNVEAMRRFASRRGEYLRKQMSEYFELGGMVDLTVSVFAGNGKVRINSVVLENPEAWQGVYFNGIPIEVEAVPSAGFVFDGWDIGELPSGLDPKKPLFKLDLDSDLHLKAHFAKVESLSARGFKR